ncbi:MAG: hypothetical protein A3C06_01265 [Candidatus Taylorbacteria bacterium RIFCSPHIGHO2_02_FULL_46_13]|uniref:Uncharacterized protein n=1 Tax=Candidatus Taylorbacteria bacterium RIFCSPHIGHO2_02_FULL_46_13 TaxID=1802312 RepID=A0A1G2MS79_9BACT|nr:MAG: hypothetical protein A3C06_01265 [Candidatus Taylorbacteria bacterium RIFCSPHIGHO2_02_FULL_46_13]
MQTETQSVIRICSFPNIRPINSIEEGLRLGNCRRSYPFITDESVPLPQVKGEKALHLVYFRRTVRADEYGELLQAEGKQPCRNAPNYLLGFISQVPEDKMPKELRNKTIVAAGLDTSSRVYNEHGIQHFLCVARFGDQHRTLQFTDTHILWRSGSWIFLAEDLVP